METFGEQPVPELNSEAFDFAAASQCFADQRTLHRTDLVDRAELTDYPVTAIEQAITFVSAEYAARHVDRTRASARPAGNPRRLRSARRS